MMAPFMPQMAAAMQRIAEGKGMGALVWGQQAEWSLELQDNYDPNDYAYTGGDEDTNRALQTNPPGKRAGGG